MNVEKNFYKCHVCGKKGDAIQFIEDFEKLSKHEAIKKAESFLINNGKNIRGTAESLGQTKISENTFSYFRKALYCSSLRNNILRKGISTTPFWRLVTTPDSSITEKEKTKINHDIFIHHKNKHL